MMELDKLIVTLSAPISETNPTGIDLREDTSVNSIYYQAKDARTHARSLERRIQQGDNTVSASELWQNVFTLSCQILEKHSKDIEACAWLIESLIRKHGLAGLNSGFLLVNNLIDKYWEQLYPQPDEDGISYKIAPLTGLNGIDNPGSLIVPIGQIIITEGKSVGPYALWQYQQALEMGQISDSEKQLQRVEQAGFSLDDIKRAVEETAADFYLTLQQQIIECKQTFKQLQTLLDDKCANDAPPTSFINNALEQLSDHFKFILQDSPHQAICEPAPSIKQELTENITTGELMHIPSNDSISVKQSINSRNEALNQLSSIANYFSQTEPHSPLPYLIRRAVDWANMPLPQLLNEIINDETARGEVYKLTGIQKQQ